MRYVDLDELVLPTGWLERAEAAAAKVEAGGDPDDGAEVWRELKDGLAALLPEKKCWYCESLCDRSDNAVDHFRPKGRVSDTLRPHMGYRWLAFEHRNYRYACTYCNSRRKGVADDASGGKADRFPLVDEADRVFEVGPVDQERPLLLDPCEPFDWKLLGCRWENGESCAASQDVTDAKRAEESIAIYHLNYAPTRVSRHATAIRLISDVDQAKRLFVLATADAEHEREFKVAAKSIARTISRKQPFSGEMMFLLGSQRSAEHPWIQDLLET